jgi:serine phosphatase RsbU (regulator of sigma subunit)
MSERKITIKPYEGSLGLRVFLISLALLILPLFLHTLLLYRHEYQQKLDDIQSILKVIGEGQRALLEERIEIQGRVLSAASTNLSSLKQGFQIAEVATSSGKGGLATISKDGESLLVTKGGQQKKTLVITTPLSEIFYQLIHFEDTPYQIAVAFVDEEGQILAGGVEKGNLRIHLPIEGASFSLLLTASENAIYNLQLRAYFFRFASFFSLVGLLGGVLVWLLMRRVSRPLQSLCTVMERVGEGALHTRYTKDWLGFEINALGLQFNAMIDRMLQHAEEAAREKSHREKLAEEMRIGHEIQLSLLPALLPELPGWEIGSGFLPAREVGGDFYDLFPLQDGSLLIVMADTAGKGISACLYSLGLRSALRGLAYSGDLSEMILRSNDLFLQDVKHSGVFVTLWAGIYDPVSKVLTYCSQGHPPAVLVRGGQVEELGTAGISLGAQTLDVVTVKKVDLKKGDFLFLYTDGVIEAHDVNQRLFGREGLFEFLVRSKKLPAQEIADQLLKEIALFSQGVAQHDDVAILSLKIHI